MDDVLAVNFLSGDVILGEKAVDDTNMLWLKNAFFVSMLHHPESGQRAAMFTPVLRGLESQDLDTCDLDVILNTPGTLSIKKAAPGLADAYRAFVSDPDRVASCVARHTSECGPSKAFVDKFEAENPRRASDALLTGNVVHGVFGLIPRDFGEEGQ